MANYNVFAGNSFTDNTFDSMLVSINNSRMAGDEGNDALQYRTVLCIKQFIRDYEKDRLKRNARIKEEIDLIVNRFRYADDDELMGFLKLRDAKKMKGNRKGIFKLRINEACRLLFFYAEYEGRRYICLHSIALEHDQQAILAENVNIDTECVPYVIKDENDFKTTPLAKPVYYAETFLPVLSAQQNTVLQARLPLVINGSAGSGKTCISVELYRRYSEIYPYRKIAYITKNAALADYVRNELQRVHIHEPECIPYTELLLLLKNGKSLITHELFDSFWNSVEKKNKVTKEEFEMCLNSIIKGDSSILDSGKECLDANVLSGKLKKENLTEKQDAIVRIYGQYSKFLSNHNLIDENDLARALYKNNRKYDFLMIDEAQDFTDLQMQALLSMCKTTDFVLLGDKNQVIAASTFDFGHFISDMREHQSVNCQRTNLKNTYRSGSLIIEYINRLSEMRKQTIGLQDQGDDEKEHSLRNEDDDLPPVIVSDEKSISEIMEVASNASNCAIIVDNENVKKQLVSGFDDAGMPCNVFTVEESKGLEYPICVLYRFSEPNRKIFEEIISGKGRKSTVHRIAFNKYYVSCTRAEDRIIICEKEENAKRFKDFLFSGVDFAENTGEILTYFNTSADSWYASAVEFYEKKNYDMAKRYFVRYGNCSDAEYTAEYERYLNYSEAHINARKATEPEELRYYIRFFSDGEPYESLNLLRKLKTLTGMNEEDRYMELTLKLRTDPDYTPDSSELLSVLSGHKIMSEDVQYFLDNKIIYNKIASANSTLMKEITNG